MGDMGYNLIGTHDEQKRTKPPCQLSRKAQLNKHIKKKTELTLRLGGGPCCTSATPFPFEQPSKPYLSSSSSSKQILRNCKYICK